MRPWNFPAINEGYRHPVYKKELYIYFSKKTPISGNRIKINLAR